MGILNELSMLFRGRGRDQKKVEPRPGSVPWQAAFETREEPQKSEPAPDKVSAH